jgi:hypothetical protein
MHFLLRICGKFTRAQLAHQIFKYKIAREKRNQVCSAAKFVEKTSISNVPVPETDP